MLVEIAVGVGLLGVGFGAGRVKNSAKLAAVKSELVKVEGSAVAEVKKLVADIKAKL